MKRFNHFLIDVEGTIVLDKKYTPASGAVKWFSNLVATGMYARLVTNNTTESPESLYRILRRKGFRFSKEDFFTCLTEAVVRMHRANVKTCLVFGKSAVKRYLAENGIKPRETDRVDGILVGFDPALTYRKMNMAVKAIVENGARLFTLHRNRRFVDEHGEIVMSSGPIAAALENASLTKAVVCGKPHRRFYLDTIKGWDVPRSKILCVSDDPFADLIGAKKLGMSTCWVLTGSQRNRDVVKKIPKRLRPDYIFNSVADIDF